MTEDSRERALEGALFALYEAWSRLPIPPGKKRPYYAEKFRQMIDPVAANYRGGVWTVRHLLYTRETSGLSKLRGRPDLTVEALVLSGKWDDIFDAYDKATAKKKLAEGSK